MQVHRYWARCTTDEAGKASADGPICALGWSDQSQADAEAHARRRAEDLARQIRSGGIDRRGPHQQYYADRPLREPIVEEIDRDGQLTAVITRNVYGAFVLNAADVMFIDIDRPAGSPLKAIGRLFGKKQPSFADQLRQRLADLVQSQRGLGLRLYETAAGFRALVTSHTIDPTSRQSDELLGALDADPRYTTLCRAQKCFRARLTPKPWRIGMPNPPGRYPWIDDDRRRAFEDWSRQYEQQITRFAACRMIDVVGEPTVSPAVAQVQNLHDRLACNEADRLA